MTKNIDVWALTWIGSACQKMTAEVCLLGTFLFGGVTGCAKLATGSISCDIMWLYEYDSVLGLLVLVLVLLGLQ